MKRIEEGGRDERGERIRGRKQMVTLWVVGRLHTHLDDPPLCLHLAIGAIKNNFLIISK